MKKLLWMGLAGFLAMLALVWCIGWFAQARHLRHAVEGAMAGLPTEMGTISAQSVEVHGFPFTLEITLVNPSGSLQLDHVLGALYRRSMALAGHSAGVLAPPRYRPATLDFLLTGTLHLRMNALADRVHIRRNGSDQISLTSEQETHRLTHEYQGPLECNLHLARGLGSALAQLWDVERFLDRERLLRELTFASCRLPESIGTQTGSQQVLSMISHAFFSVERIPDDARLNLKAQLAIKDQEVFPEGDATYNALLRAMTPIEERTVPFNASLYGQQQFEAQMELDTPTHIADFKNSAYRIHIPRLLLKNAASNTQLSFLMSATPAGNGQKGELQWHTIADFTPRQRDIAKMTIAPIVRDLLQNPEYAHWSDIPQEQIEQAMYDALPDLTEMGTLTQQAKLTYSLDSTQKEADISLEALEFSSRDYGLSAQGKAKFSQSNLVPAADANLECRNCLAMLDTIAAYLQRAESIMQLAPAEQRTPLHIPPEELAGLKQLLSALGHPSPNQPTTLQFAIRSDTGAIQINGKGLAEVMQMVQHYLPGP